MYLDKKEFLEVVKLTPLVSIDLIIKNEDGRVLLGQRTNEPAKGMWFVPGGRIQKDISIERAFEGILHDEVGVHIPFADAEFLGVYEHIYRENFANEKGYGTHYVVLGYQINVDGIEIDILPDDQHDGWRWFTIEEVLSNDQVHINTKAYFSPTI